MSDTPYYGVLAHPTARQHAARACLEYPEGYVVKIMPPTKTREQECHYHAILGDIAKQWRFMGKRLHQDDVKRLFVDAFAKVKRDMNEPLHHDGRVMPSLDGERIVQLGIQTADFWVKEASDFIEFLLAWCAENGIRLEDRTRGF